MAGATAGSGVTDRVAAAFVVRARPDWPLKTSTPAVATAATVSPDATTTRTDTMVSLLRRPLCAVTGSNGRTGCTPVCTQRPSPSRPAPAPWPTRAISLGRTGHHTAVRRGECCRSARSASCSHCKNRPVRAQVIVLAGPSGSGKSRLAERIGLPVLRLDDFYKSAGDPTLPLITEGANAGIVDWDVPESWLLDDAMAALDELCRTGRAEVPIYDIAQNGRCGTADPRPRRAPTSSSPRGSSPRRSSARCGDAGLLAAAYCVRQHPMVTFWRRLTRDLRERRKPPLVLVRRGLALMRDQRRVVSHAVERGCTPVTPDEAYAAIGGMARATRDDAGP